MSAYRVAIVADDATLHAPTAVVRIDGLREWPAGATLRILPIDETAIPPKSEGWPWGDITPLRVLPTEDGVDVVLGPDIVGCSRLTPGTPIIVQVPVAQLEVEARWPSVTPTVRRRATAVAMSAGQMLAIRAEKEQQAKATAARRQELAEFAIKQAASEAAAQVSQTGQAPVGVAGAPARPGDNGQLARLLPMRRGAAAPSPEASAPPPGSLPVAGAAKAPASLRSPGKIDVAPTTSTPVTPCRPSRLWPFLAGAATLAALMAAGSAVAPSGWAPPGLSRSSVTASADQFGFRDLQTMFKEFAATGNQSPQNKPAAGVDVATALSLADHSLRGDRTPAETAEAVFWLKRALTASFGAADVGWALTQLGTIYATPGTPEHSYVKAHTIWQLAAAQGDPVAHCFLGALYEHGLGVQRSRPTALEHYKAAQALGACRSADDAVARLSQSE